MQRFYIRNRHLIMWKKLWLILGLIMITLILVVYSSRATNRISLQTLNVQSLHQSGLGLHAKAFYNRVNAAIANFSASPGVLVGPASRHFAYSYNVSRTRLAGLLADTVQIMELKMNAQKTLAYMLTIHPDYDANAGSCRCGQVSELCHCCARVALKALSLEQTVCINFYYQADQQALKTRIVIGGSQVIVDQLLGVANPPLLCVGGSLELCARFRNTTYTVGMNHNHKMKLQGCLDLLVNLLNTTVSAHPMGCFEAKGDSVRLPRIQ